MGQLVAVRSFVAEAAISANRVVTFGATDDNVLTAVAVTSTLIGIVEGVSPVLGERVDVVMTGIADLQIGGSVTRGAYITVDAQGRGVAAAPAAGVNNNDYRIGRHNPLNHSRFKLLYNHQRCLI